MGVLRAGIFQILMVAGAVAAMALASTGAIHAQDKPESRSESAAEAAVYAEYARYQAALEAGDFEAIQKTAEETYAAAQKAWSEGAELAAITYNYAQVMELAGEQNKAAAAYSQCADLFAALGGAHLANAATCSLKEGLFRLTDGNNRAAHRAFEKAIEFAEPYAEENLDAAYAVGMSYLALAQMIAKDTWRLRKRPLRARYKKVEELAVKAEHFLAIAEPDSRNVANAIVLQGYYYETDEQWAEALDRYSRAKSLFELYLEEDDEILLRLFGRVALSEAMLDLGTSDNQDEDNADNAEGDSDEWSSYEKDGKTYRTRKIRSVPPEFPNNSLFAGQSGFALARFDVTKEGRTENIRIIESWPADNFDVAVKQAVRRWRYEPPTADDGSVAVYPDVQVFFLFLIEG